MKPSKHAGAVLLLGALLSVTACQQPPPSRQVAPEGFVDVLGGKVFYKTMGGGDKTPLLLLHGGPGGRSCAFAVLSELATDRRVIRYDQLGSGQSDRPADLSLWRTERFVDELDAVRKALHLDRVHILGHSWGGTLATEYLLTKGQQGVVSVILSSPLISTPRWLADARRLRSTLPESVQSVLNRCEAVETADDPTCQAANDVFEEQFVRGAKTLPAVPECEGITGGDPVYRHMWGAAEFTATGLLRDYDRSDRLGELTLPVLFLAGRHDEAAPETIADFQRRVPGAKMAVLENSAHSTYRTETAEYVKIVRQFLQEAESKGPRP
jgi:proline iminopeptidase